MHELYVENARHCGHCVGYRSNRPGVCGVVVRVLSSNACCVCMCTVCCVVFALSEVSFFRNLLYGVTQAHAAGPLFDIGSVSHTNPLAQ